MKEKKKSNKWIYDVAIVICILVFVVSGFFLGRWLYENYKTKKMASQLQDMVGMSESTVEEDGVEGYRCCECGHTITVEEYTAACEQYYENVYAIL